LSKDNAISALIGLLIGFISAYLGFEAMSARQPARFVPGSTAPGVTADPDVAGSQAAPPPGAQNPGAAPGAGAGPAMAEVQEMQNRVDRDPNDADAVLALANMNFDIQNWPKARDLYARYLELRPGNPDILSDLGVTYRELKEYDKALELFNQAQTVAPDHWQSRFNEVIVLAFDLKKFDEADKVLEELRRMQPGNADIERLASEVERQRGAA
jgi:tetratricopeptide (TPR) repeat protein